MVKRRFRVVLNGEVYDVEVEVEEGLSELETLLRSLETGVIRRVEAMGSTNRLPGSILAPITGRVVEIRVKPGERVDKGDILLIMEAMKTRVEIKSPKSGSITRIYVNTGDTVKQGTPLLTIS